MKQIVIYCADAEAYRQSGMTFPLYIVSPWFSVTLENEEAEAIVLYQEDSLQMLESSLPAGIGYRVEDVKTEEASDTKADEHEEEQAEAQEEQTQGRRRRKSVGGE